MFTLPSEIAGGLIEKHKISGAEAEQIDAELIAALAKGSGTKKRWLAIEGVSVIAEANINSFVYQKCGGGGPEHRRRRRRVFAGSGGDGAIQVDFSLNAPYWAEPELPFGAQLLPEALFTMMGVEAPIFEVEELPPGAKAAATASIESGAQSDQTSGSTGIIVAVVAGVLVLFGAFALGHGIKPEPPSMAATLNNQTMNMMNRTLSFDAQTIGMSAPPNFQTVRF
jgi:hypothetical protein